MQKWLFFGSKDQRSTASKSIWKRKWKWLCLAAVLSIVQCNQIHKTKSETYFALQQSKGIFCHTLCTAGKSTWWKSECDFAYMRKYFGIPGQPFCSTVDCNKWKWPNKETARVNLLCSKDDIDVLLLSSRLQHLKVIFILWGFPHAGGRCGLC